MSELWRLGVAVGWRIGSPGTLAALLAVVAVAAGAGALGLVRRRRLLRRSFGPLAPLVAPRASSGGRAARLVLACAGLTLLSIGAARPERGVRAAEAPAPALDLAIAVDASRSMLARDVSPDRIGAARAALTALVERLGPDRAAVVAFAGAPRIDAPLTPDRRAVALLLGALDPGTFAPQGTDVGAALDAARRALSRGGDRGAARALLLVSDGEDHAGDAAAAADRAALDGTTLFTLGVGTADGAEVPGADGAALVDAGRPVVSRLASERLEELAARGGGKYVHLGDAGAVEDLAAALERVRQSGARTIRISGWDERPEPFAVAGLALLLLSVTPLPPRHLRARARAAPPAPPARPESHRPGRRRAAAVAALALFLGGAAPFLAAHDGLERANALARRDPAAALPLFDEVEEDVGRHPEIDVDRALALHRAGRIEDARRAFALAARGRGPLASRAAYAEGVAAYGAGDEDGAIAAWRRALVLDPANGAARFNLEVALRRRVERRAHPGARAGPERQQQGAEAREGGDERRESGPEPSPSEAPRTRPRRDAPGQGGPMSVADAERLLDEVAAGERVAPRGARSRRDTAPEKAW